MTTTTPPGKIIYPESDGKPLSDNTKQFELITVIHGNIDTLVPDFVAGDLSWFPVRGKPKINKAPDVMVALGRPKGHRRSYRQWEEENIAPQVVFQIASPSNSRKELEETKLEFYQDYGVEEYYIYDPDRVQLKGWRRQGKRLEPIESMLGWVSPQLGIRFEIIEDDLKLFFPDGEPFATYRELMARVELERQQKELERQRADRAEERAAQLAARLQELGIDPDSL